MRNRHLHDALRAFALDSARVLSNAMEAGDELRFELDAAETKSGRSILYRYRALTDEFIGARWDSLRELASFMAAAEALGSGSAAYLRAQGLAGADAEPALLAMLERIYDDASDFGFPEERFEKVYSEVEHTLYDGVMQASLVAPIPGLVMERDRVELGDGLALVRGDLVEAPTEAVWPAGDHGLLTDGLPYTLATLEFELSADENVPLAEVRWRLRRLLTALRLFRSGGVGCGEYGWVRSDQGRWRPFPLHPSGPARGEAWVLHEDQVDEFRDFAAHTASWQAPGVVGWALDRFEMGCERPGDADALPDYMLALRSLLDASDDAGRASLSLRVAALCAEQTERRGLQLRIERLVALERALSSGVPFDLAADGDGEDLVAELEDHLRAVLRDIACGYLAPDLKAVADDLLLRTEPFEEIRARDTRAEAPPTPTPEPKPEAPEPEPTADWEPDWAPPEVAPEPVRQAPRREPEPTPFRPPPSQREPVAAGSQSQQQLVVDDFAWDVDEADDWSAPA